MPSRRRILGAIAASATASTAGCSVIGGDGDDTGESNDGADESAASGGSTGPTDAATDGDTDGPPGEEGTPASADVVATLVGPDGEYRLFDGTGVESIGAIDTARGGTPFVPLTLTDEAATAVTSTVREADASNDPGEYEVTLAVDGETVYRGGVTAGLLTEWRQGEWGGRVQIRQPTRAAAEDLRGALRRDS